MSIREVLETTTRGSTLMIPIQKLSQVIKLPSKENSVYYLNIWLFDLYGTNGLALATLIVIFVFNTIKLIVLKFNLNITPITNKTFISLFLIVGLFFAFYFWNFKYHPIINIALKTIIISVVYLLAAVKLKISSEINHLLTKILKL